MSRFAPIPLVPFYNIIDKAELDAHIERFLKADIERFLNRMIVWPASAPIIDHDPGDEDRRPDGPWCSRCGDAFEGPERPCPNPASGRPYVDCGRGGHMFDKKVSNT